MKSSVAVKEMLISSKKANIAALATVVMASLGLGLLSQVFVPLPFTPIPVSFRLQAVLALACLLPGRLALYSTALFLLEGIVGMPFFAAGAGLAGLLGPSGGYLLGYLAVSIVTPWLISKSKSKSLRSLLAVFSLATIIVYAIGSLWLSLFVGLKAAVALGIVPFILVDVCKNILLASLIKGLYSLRK